MHILSVYKTSHSKDTDQKKSMVCTWFIQHVMQEVHVCTISFNIRVNRLINTDDKLSNISDIIHCFKYSYASFYCTKRMVLTLLTLIYLHAVYLHMLIFGL